MELMDDPEFKKSYIKCKKIVKVWEYRFKKKHGRIPSKHDIREADKSIRSAYGTYFRMKTAILDESLSGLDGFKLDDDYSHIETSSSVTCISQKKLLVTESEAVAENHSVNNTKTWGDHLSMNKAENSESVSTSDSRGNVYESYTKKLFVGSKFTKRNPRKSQTFSQNRLKSFKSNATITASQQQSNFSSFEITYEELDDNLLNDVDVNVKYTIPAPQVQSKSLNLVQSLISNTSELQQLRSIDTGWLARVAKETNTDIVNPELESCAVKELHVTNNYESDDVFEPSDEESRSKILHLSKKRRFNLPETSRVQKCVEEYIIEKTPEKKRPNDNLITVDHVNTKRLNFSNIFTKTSPKEGKTEEVKENLGKVYEFTEPENVAAKTKVKQKKLTYRSRKKNTNAKAAELAEKPDNFRKSKRKSKPLVDLQKNSDSEDIPEDPFQCDSDQDPDYSETDETKKKSKLPLADFEIDEEKMPTAPKAKQKVKKSPGQPKTKKSPGQPKAKKSPRQARTPKSKKPPEPEDTTEQDTYELEYSVKPRIATVPRFKTIPNVSDVFSSSEDSKPALKDKREQARQKLEQKVASRSLNDNFVTIDLKKKVFVRGHKHLNFSKMKKMQWKDRRKARDLCGPDMDMGGCDGGKLICFRCGGEGHFAQRCPNVKGDVLLPLQADQEVCPYPTLEDAARMAQGSVSAVRKPTVTVPEVKEGDVAQPDVVDETDDENNGRNSASDREGSEKGDFDCLDDSFDEELMQETLRIEDLIPKIDTRMYLDAEKSVKPLYSLKEDGGLIDTPVEVLEALKLFNHGAFRAGQEAAVMRILSGLSTLVTLSTGSGKSLCYQLPAYLYSRRQKCISLVISPLVSLMEDQVTGIPSMLKAACLHTNQTKPQRDKIMEQIKQGDLDVLLVSPEAIVAGEKSSGFGSLLRQLPPIAFACIDEAHCVSQWSHNFRPSYLMICRVLRDRLGVRTVLGLTATATRATSDSIVEHLQIPDGRLGIIADVPLPDNLHLNVSRDGNRDSALLALLLSEKFKDLRSVIVYCTRREECERIAGFLRTALQDEARKPVEFAEPSQKGGGRKRKRTNNAQAECYHAGMSASRRRTVQRSFMNGELRIVVATVAFGMGINKSDIRSVIHYNLPRNFESYVQEVGRAGRDGLPAYCHLFLDSQGRDENELKRHVHSNSMDRHVIRKLLQKIFLPCACRARCPRHEVAFPVEKTVRHLDIPEEIISTLLCYLELHEKRFIEVLSPAYTTCKVVSYGGPTQIRKAALDCPPLTMALALRKTKDGIDENVLEFPVVDIAAAMGWDSGITKHKLKNLEWTSENGRPKRSLLNVTFSNLGFRLLAPGNLTDAELDEALDSLYARVVDQERTALLQLQAICTTVVSAAKPRFQLCYRDDPTEKPAATTESEGTATSATTTTVSRCFDLKAKIREYFDSPQPLEMLPEIEIKPVNEGQVVTDIRALVSMYRDNVFTGRAVARIFHGIQSPNYPAVIWGRCKFWRAHLNSDFNYIIQIATKELIRLR